MNFANNQKFNHMDFNDYQELAERTSKFSDSGYSINRLLMATLGVAGESGEVADYIKKHIFHDHPLDIFKLMKELGDVLWYLAEICNLYNVKLETVARLNIEKLDQRYPDKFSSEKSIHRNE